MAFKQAQEASFDINKIASSVEKELSEISFQASREVSLIDSYRPEFSARIEAIGDGSGGLLGLTTGFPDLDVVSGGFVGGDLWIVASRPAMGKTALAVSFLEAVAKKGIPVLMISLEMSGSQIYARLACSKASVNILNFRSGKLLAEDYGKFIVAEAEIQPLPFYLADTAVSGCDEANIRGIIRKAVRKYGIKLVVIDYLQLMGVKGHRGSRENEVSTISRALKRLARQLDIPIVALCQLSRKCEERPNKRPVMSDLRESGAIEQDADGIIGLYRDEYYNKESDSKGIAEVMLLKQRNGPACTVKLQFAAAFARFGNLDKDRQEPETQKSFGINEWE
jgi:replicative DNA helicase